LVALDLPAGDRFVEWLLRAWDAGDAVMPLDSRLSAAARQRLVQEMRPACVVGPDGSALDLPGVPVEAGDALVMITSGTTAAKGVVLTHAAVAASAAATNERLAADAALDRWWACLPFAHVGGLSVVTRCLAAGIGYSITSFSPAAARAAQEGGATLTSLVPTTLGRLDPATVEGFRQIVLGGQAPPPLLPANVVTTYGLTETGSGVVYDGLPLRGVEVRIAEHGPRRGEGEIHLRGPMLLRSYRDGIDPKNGDGWLPTGDGGSIGDDGRLRVHGRISEMIITGGENVWPLAVERVLRTDPTVAEAAVVGVDDAEWGQRVVAFVQLTSPADPVSLLGRLRELVREELAPYAAPRQVVVVDAFPITALGKIRKALLDVGAGPSASV
jgi:O-succinylbenzoic acid--CoA ligase